MIPSEVENFLNNWLLDIQKGFEYKDYTVYYVEYLIINKTNDNLYEVLKDKSSINVGPFNKEAMTKLLGSDRLVCICDNAYIEDYKYKKNKGCYCGAWATNEPNCHSFWCPKYTR